MRQSLYSYREYVHIKHSAVFDNAIVIMYNVLDPVLAMLQASLIFSLSKRYYAASIMLPIAA